MESNKLEGIKPRKSLDVVGAAIVDGNKILCAQRGYGELIGKWEFPGGKIEPGETPEQAIIREIREELNIDIKVNKHIETSHYDYPTFHINLAVFECEIIAGEINDHEHESLKWLNKQDMKILDWCPADIPVLKKIIG